MFWEWYSHCSGEMENDSSQSQFPNKAKTPKWVETPNLRSSHRTNPYSSNGLSETDLVRLETKVSRQRFGRRCQLCKQPAHIHLAHTSLRIPHRTREDFLSLECLQLAIPAINSMRSRSMINMESKFSHGNICLNLSMRALEPQPEAYGETRK